jgi:MoaA/NifB/PqqE/SkfB family radical SAM enzyme
LNFRSELVIRLRSLLDRHPGAKHLAKRADIEAARLQHRVAITLPSVIRPRPRQLTIAVTANCNLRCTGCGYGRDFMPGAQLSLDVVRQLIDDARAGGVETVRLYGGEPLLHPDLSAMVRHATSAGLRAYVTTNGNHLGQKIDGLYEAGLRLATIGFYGLEPHYTAHTGRAGHFARLEASLATVRERYGKSFDLQLNFVLMRGTCNLDSLAAAWEFAERFDMFFHLDLASPSIPFFRSTEAELLPREEDRPALEALAVALLAYKREQPGRLLHSPEFLRSIPDWLLKGTGMNVPCDAYNMIWIGADGSVQLCDTAFPLGNVNQTRLSDILFGPAHTKAAQDAFKLNCPNCTCHVDSRIQKHAPSLRRYRELLPGERAHV